MAAEDPDLVIFLGDYIYEGSVDPAKAQGLARRHQTPDPVDLTGYRLRYAAYHTDPDLQAVHAAAPCLMTWDDHEVENDYADQWSEHPSTDPAAFLLRRAAAYRAYWEHMPLRWRSLPKGPNARVYDRFRFGDLAEVSILDGRQYRSMEACPRPDWRGGHVVTAECTERDDPRRTMLGFEQERWLTDGFRHASARWNLVAQDLLVAAAHQKDAKTGEIGHWTDAWDGYPACRTRVLKAVADSRLSNPVFLGGDIHSFWTTDLKADFDDPSSATVATEFVGTSITSDGPDYDLFMSTMPMNPHVKFFDSRVRGYVSCDLRPDRLETAFRTISDRADPNATVSTLKRFVVESGRAGATEA
ncbi:MAG: alkaline phosphatase D family protein [Caulobacteraceae bacterium]